MDLVFIIGAILFYALLFGSTMWGILTIAVALKEFDDSFQKFTVIFAAIGWFLLGLYLGYLI